MKNTIYKLRVGDQIWAQVVEHISASEFIVSFQGDLVRVRNESLCSLKPDEKILVRVMSLAPLSVQNVQPGDTKRAATRIDVSV